MDGTRSALIVANCDYTDAELARPLPDVPYAATLLWTIGAAIVGSMVAEVAVSIGAR